MTHKFQNFDITTTNSMFNPDVEYFKCTDCGLLAFKENSGKMFISDCNDWVSCLHIDRETVSSITCDEVIIRSIIE